MTLFVMGSTGLTQMMNSLWNILFGKRVLQLSDYSPIIILSIFRFLLDPLGDYCLACASILVNS